MGPRRGGQVIFSQTAEYALRAMACLVRDAQGAVMTSEELAQRARIPSHYVSKVMRQLVLAGLVEARRGHGGGFRLVADPDTITFAAILEAVGEAPGQSECVFGLGPCPLAEPCPLHDSWRNLNRAVADWAATHTLGALAPSGPRPEDSAAEG